MVIARSAVRAFLARSLPSYAWIKKAPRAEIDHAISLITPRPRFKTRPWDHQAAAWYVGACEPRFMFLMDMGTGKTKVVLDLISQARRERRLTCALILVPRLINLDSWDTAVSTHSSLEASFCGSGTAEEKWLKLSEPDCDLMVIDYAGLMLALTKKERKTKGKGNDLVIDEDRVKVMKHLYNFVCLDEIHKLQNHQSLWFRILRRLTMSADYCYGLTGTLFGKNPEGLWAPFYLMDRGETFGTNLGLFRSAFFKTKMNPWKGLVYEYNSKMDVDLNRMLQSRSLRYEEHEVSELPERVALTYNLHMSDEQQEHYLRAVDGLIQAGGRLADLDGQFIRMRQIISGYLRFNDKDGKVHQINFKQNPKLEKLEQLVEDIIPTSKVVVAYDYTETGRIITERLTKLKIKHVWLYGGTKDSPATLRQFLNDPKIRVLVMNSEAGGTGVDGLQAVARHLIYYESPTPPITRQQTTKRIHRSGQKHRSFIIDLVMAKSLDGRILGDIKDGIDLHDRVVNGKAAKGWLLGGT